MVVIWYSSAGIKIISLPVSSSVKDITSVTTYSSLSAFCETTPTFSMASTKNLEDPSMMGGSEASSSMMALSTSIPTKAANMCSDV
jgi:hypothetical protein